MADSDLQPLLKGKSPSDMVIIFVARSPWHLWKSVLSEG